MKPQQIDSHEVCLLEEALEPCAIVIFGATGDLASRKLFPALFDLYLSNILPDHFVILGCGRTELNNEGFKERIKKILQGKKKFDQDAWRQFSKILYYQLIDYDSEESFSSLEKNLINLEARHKSEGNRIFYLALPPSMYPVLATMIGRAGLGCCENDTSGWIRFVIEKPFGRDLESGLELDRILHKYFQEKQIFRIDHYLAKETVQNILLFRFANAIFEPVWNRQYIDHIRINAVESLGIEHRAGYYEQSGVIRDMFQNHMMQLLALTAMEPPSCFDTKEVQDEKIKVFRALRPFDQNRLQEDLILGQYGAGEVDGNKVVGYRDESGVEGSSIVPTFASMKLFIDNWRWQGVPFYLTSGKRLAGKCTEIIIQFRQVPHSMLRDLLGEHITTNRLVIGIAPEEKINLTFQTKKPGAALCLKTVTMNFLYKDQFSEPAVDGYGKVLIECIQGDQLLFWRQDGVEKSWQFLTPILECWDCCDNRQEMLMFYPAGSQLDDVLHLRQ